MQVSTLQVTMNSLNSLTAIILNMFHLIQIKIWRKIRFSSGKVV
jgi:hypothetical protein